MDSLKLEKRLIVAEDVDFDLTGSGATVEIANGSGGFIEGHKINAGHLPLSSGTAQAVGSPDVDGAIENLQKKLDAVSTVSALDDDLTVAFDAADTEEDIQGKIDAVVKNLGGHTVTFVFPELIDHSLLASIEWKGFYNGTVIVEGNGTTVTHAAELNCLFHFADCQCRVVIRNFTFTYSTTLFALWLERCPTVEIVNCIFNGVARTTYAVKLRLSNAVFDSCSFNGGYKTLVEGILGAAGGGGHQLFEMFYAHTIEAPAGAERLDDGHTLYNCDSGDSPYYDFYQEALARKVAGTISTVTAAQYESQIAVYGQCGSFVIDEVAKSIRLPKITDFIQIGTPGTVHNAGLPNITGTTWGERSGDSSWVNISGAFFKDSAGGSANYGRSATDHDNTNLGFDASLCNSIYGGANTVQPKSAETRLYMQVSLKSASGSGDGGNVYVTSGDAEQIASGAAVNVVSGAIVSSGLVDSGAVLDIVSGAGYVTSGGVVWSGGVVSGAVTFASSVTASGGQVVVASRGLGWYATCITIPSSQGNDNPVAAHYVVSGNVSCGYYAQDNLGGRWFYYDVASGVSAELFLSKGVASLKTEWPGNGGEADAVVECTSGGIVLSRFYPTDDGTIEEKLFTSGGKLLFSGGSGGTTRSGNVLLDTDPLPGQSGAIVSGAEIITSVGDYLLTYTSSGGLMVSGGGVSFRVSSGGIVASGEGGESVVLSGGTVSLRVNDNAIDMDEYSTIIHGGVEASIGAGQFTYNGNPIMTELVTSTDSETTSASFAELAGGTAYIYTQPLTALTVASVTSDCDATIKFTAGAGLSQIGLPSSCYFTGESAFTSGAHYFAAFNGADVVVIQQQKLDEA